MMNLICLMDHILLQIYKIILNKLSKKIETIANNHPAQIYVSRIKNRIVFKIKKGYKLELLCPEIMKLLRSTKKGVD